MNIIKIVIEKGSDGYGAYSENTEKICGMGDTVQECKQSVLDCIETIRTGFPEDQVPEALKGDYVLEYRFDPESFFRYLKGYVSNAGIERLTGVSQNLISQYASGAKTPSRKQRDRIQQGLRRLADELYSISF